MRFCSLGSGSEGNALLVECIDGHRRVRLLIDCGFGLREAQRRLGALGIAPESLDAILVTHEHGDHVGGAYKLGLAHEIPVVLTRGTLRASGPLAQRAIDSPGALRLIDPDQAFEVAGVHVMPVRVPHDAAEAVQYVIDSGGLRLGVLTDLGHASAHVVRSYCRLDALVLEANHDENMLRASDYPQVLKRRIAGPYGHLSNEAAAALLGALDQSRLHTICAAHLSQQNNRVELATSSLARACGRNAESIQVADQHDGLDWISAAPSASPSLV